MVNGIAKCVLIAWICIVIGMPANAQQNPYKQGEIIALVYHRFGDNRHPSTNIKNETFKRQLQYLKQHNYNVISLFDACEKLYNGDGVPPKTVVITIDDGYKSFFENGFPLLKQNNFPATIFINTENVGNGDYMSWEELGILLDAGIEIGNHSHSHNYFLNEDTTDRADLLRNEIIVSQDLFAKHIEYVPQVFSYPYGESDASMKEEVKQMGYKYAAAQNSGVISLFTDPYNLPRFPMNERYGSLESFTAKIQMHALPVVKTEPEDPFFEKNPPALCLTLDPKYIDQDQLQCFIGGNKSCNMTIFKCDDNMIKVKVISQNPLSKRRTLYTVTAPLKNGKGWCWYSHVWIAPELRE